MRSALLFAMLTLTVPLTAAADGADRAQRMPTPQAVILNGEALPDWKLDRLQELTCARVAPGAYWLAADGTWGFAGNGLPQGIAWDGCFGGRQFGIGDPTGAFAALPGAQRPIPPIPGASNLAGKIAFAGDAN